MVYGNMHKTRVQRLAMIVLTTLALLVSTSFQVRSYTWRRPLPRVGKLVDAKRCLVTFVCGDNSHWELLDDMIFEQNSWDTPANALVYVCDPRNMRICLEHNNTLFPGFNCRRQTLNQRTETNVFKTASILQALSEEIQCEHFLFLDVDIGFRNDLWADLGSYMDMDMVFSNQAGEDTWVDVNIGAVLVRQTNRSIAFWQTVYDTIVNSSAWDQQVVSDMVHDNSLQVRYDAIPRRSVYAFGESFRTRGST